MGVYADTRNVCRMLDSDKLEARPGAGPDGPLDVQDDIGIAESERELPEIIDQDLDGNIRVSSSIILKRRCFCNFTSFLLNLSVLKRNVSLVQIITADTWNRVAVSLVSFDSTSKGRTHYSVLVKPSFNTSDTLWWPCSLTYLIVQ